MRIIHSVCFSIIIGASIAGHAYAADEVGDLDVTIRVIDSKQGINEFINRIELPRSVAETAPAATDQNRPSPGATSQPGQAADGSAQKRRDPNRNRENRQHNSGDGRTSDGPQDQQTDSPISERAAATGDSPRNDADLRDRDRASDSREHHENFQSNTREQQESVKDQSRDNWDRFRDSYPPSAWPPQQK